MEAILILFVFFILFFACCSTIYCRVIRSIIACFGAIYIVLQVVSLYFTKTFISYQFYVHANVNATSIFFRQFAVHILLFVVLLIVLYFLFYHANSLKTNKFLILLCIVSSLLAITTNKKFKRDSQSLQSIFCNEATSFQNTLNQNNMSDYTLMRHLICKNRTQRNVIVLSLESYEKSLIECKSFEKLTPNLRKLKNTWHYFQLQTNAGSEWTSGSIYTCLTGFPAFFGVHGNQIFQSTYHTEMVSLPQVFNKTNHYTMYLIGNSQHAGLQDMFKTLGIDSIVDDNSFDEKEFVESNYGLHDYDLFEIAKEQLSQFRKNKQSFALFISTIDTHAPNGIYDKRMEKVINRKEEMTDWEFMVAAVDKMVDDFIHYLQQNNWLENTTVFIFPDHLKMGDASMFNNCERGLFLLTNANTEMLQIDTTKTLYQLDLPKIILNGATIEHNAKFLTDFINNDSNYLNTHIRQLTLININGLLRSDTTRIPTEFRQ